MCLKKTVFAGAAFAVGMFFTVPLSVAQGIASSPGFHGTSGQSDPERQDSDRDGMSDALEQALLVQFAPTFQVGRADCSNIPAEFKPGVTTPTVLEENGTIYGQVSPVQGQALPGTLSMHDHPVAEIHYYHLWRRDCGGHGHPLDTEHVAVLVQASDTTDKATWKALYWYAAAHENTVCDVSQIARASTLGAEDHGAKIWISPGKHASYLNATLCQRGCGADHCDLMVALPVARLINLGEVDHVMNASVFVSSKAWPLAFKMTHTNFPESAIARLNGLPETDIAWFNPGRHPAQGIIAVSSSTEQSIAGGGHNTSVAISLAGDSTSSAVSTAADSTGNAIDTSYRKTKHALGKSLRQVGKALHLEPKDAPPN